MWFYNGSQTCTHLVTFRYLGMYCSDLAFVEETPDFVNGMINCKSLINSHNTLNNPTNNFQKVSKLEMVARLVNKIMVYKKRVTLSEFAEDSPSVQGVIMQTPKVKDKDSYKLSIQLEPNHRVTKNWP